MALSIHPSIRDTITPKPLQTSFIRLLPENALGLRKLFNAKMATLAFLLDELAACL